MVKPSIGLLDEPLVSIVTAVRNGRDFLEELIHSIVAQDYPNIEHIVVDDGSDDNGATVSVLRRHPQVRWWSQQNKGQYASQNEGLAVARGDIVGVISADDLYVVPSAISSVIEFWRRHPECGCVYGRTLRMTGDGVPMPESIDTTGPYPLWFLRYHLFIQHCSLFVSTRIIKDHSVQFDPTLRYAGDWDWIIRLARTGERFGYLDRPLALFRKHPASTTNTGSRRAMFEEYRTLCHRYGTNYPLVFGVRKLLDFRAGAIRALWALRGRGQPLKGNRPGTRERNAD